MAEDEVIRQAYSTLYENIQRKKGGLTKGSVLLSLISMTSNPRFELLKSSAFSGRGIPRARLEELLAKKWVRRLDTPDKYVITAYGIWEVEEKEETLNTEKLVEYLEDEIFDLYKVSEKPLKDSEKLILFSMITARAFSDKVTVNLKKDEIASETWKEIFDTVYNEMRTLGLISTTKEKLYENKPNETSISYIFRRVNDLHKKTQGIFVQTGKQKYFLDIYDSTNLDVERLKYLFRLIFSERHFSAEEIDSIYEFMSNIAYKKNGYIFETGEHFARPVFDNVIREALLAS